MEAITTMRNKPAWLLGLVWVACANEAPPPNPAAAPAPLDATSPLSSQSMSRSPVATSASAPPDGSNNPLTGVSIPPDAGRIQPASPEACKKAEKLRRTGFHKMLNLELDAAKLDFQEVLRLDPGDIGALHQLDVIDAIETGRQVSMAEQNSNIRSQVTRSRCPVTK